MIYPIRYYGDPILKQRARSVTMFNEDLKTLARDMLETTYDARGIGLAAPQIGIPYRVFVALEGSSEDGEDPLDNESYAALSLEEKRQSMGIVNEYVMINPRILRRSGVQYGLDGCLSIPGVYFEDMPRDLNIEVAYQDVDGHSHHLQASGHLAHVIQHEYDHLEGVLFLDRIPKDKKKSYLNDNRKELADIQREAKVFLKELRKQAFVPPKLA